MDAGRDGAQESAKFQINISISTKKFDALLKVAISGRLPSKFFVDAGEKVSRTETRGLTYRMAPKGRTKVWDNKSFAFLPVTNFSAIIPISVPEPPPAPSADADQSSFEPPASYGQVGDLAEELAVFRRCCSVWLTSSGDERHSTKARGPGLPVRARDTIYRPGADAVNRLDFQNRAAVVT